ncbi:uncharacterized protein LOC123290517 [Chrysoperla carnea]|uniref:uncharacterized protein LOC123290517 n=1 Tax=Chrysoperla carnea TaxID=189513 RepID=UPI001D069D1E|nr:uncharacterized protein LOC123290517 [Chrysoperla carnea]
MNSIKLLLSTIIGYISIVTINGELIKLDGQCPISGLKPSAIAKPEYMKGIFNVVEESSMGNVSETKSNGRVLLTPESEQLVNIRERYLPKDAEQCSERQIKLTYTGTVGIYNVSYQADADSSFEDGYKGYILVIRPYIDEGQIGIHIMLLFICRNISDSQYEFDIPVYSRSSMLTKIVRKEIQSSLEDNNLESLDKYVKREMQKEKCKFSDQEENEDYFITKPVMSAENRAKL